jgi:hypothetical protein
MIDELRMRLQRKHISMALNVSTGLILAIFDIIQASAGVLK